MLSSESLAKELLEILFNNCQGLYIVLDGLDECSQREEKSILEWFRSVMKFSNQSAPNSWHARCVFISQRDAITTRYLRDLPTIAITSSNNLPDITSFVSSWARKIQRKFDISVDDTNNMAEMVVEKAAGSRKPPHPNVHFYALTTH